jgi:hypothetical protein
LLFERTPLIASQAINSQWDLVASGSLILCTGLKKMKDPAHHPWAELE